MPNITTNHAIILYYTTFFVDRKKKDNEYGVSRGVDFQGDMN